MLCGRNPRGRPASSETPILESTHPPTACAAKYQGANVSGLVMSVLVNATGKLTRNRMANPAEAANCMTGSRNAKKNPTAMPPATDRRLNLHRAGANNAGPSHRRLLFSRSFAGSGRNRVSLFSKGIQRQVLRRIEYSSLAFRQTGNFKSVLQQNRGLLIFFAQAEPGVNVLDAS